MYNTPQTEAPSTCEGRQQNRWVDSVGALDVVRRLERHEKQFGKRFTPAPVLVELAQSGATFHGERAIKPGKIGSRAQGERVRV